MDNNQKWEDMKSDIHSPFLVMLHSTLINRSIHKTAGEMAQEIINVFEKYAVPAIKRKQNGSKEL